MHSNMLQIVLLLALYWILMWCFKKGDLSVLGLTPTRERMKYFFILLPLSSVSRQILPHVHPTCFHVLLLYLMTACHHPSRTSEPTPPEVRTDTHKIVGGGCEGCELMYIGMPEQIQAGHTSIGWEQGKTKLILKGKVLKSDGQTPAPDVLIYYWHTDDKGLYSGDLSIPEKARKHGKLRGWIRTDTSGNYFIHTSRPAAYPSQDIPQHIHLSIKEPDIQNEYFADLYFEDDPLYAAHQKKYGILDRAGSELLKPRKEGKVYIAEHHIILGMNIPDYPK